MKLTEKDQENFEQLDQILRDADLGMNMPLADKFMEQAKNLTEKIPMYLDGSDE